MYLGLTFPSFNTSLLTHIAPISLFIFLFCKSLSLCLQLVAKEMSTRGSNHVSNGVATKKATPAQKPNSSSNKVVDNKSSNGICGLRGSNQVSCIPSINKETAVRKRSCVSRVPENKRSAGTCGIRLPKKPEFSPVRLLKHLRNKMAKGLCSVSLRKRSPPAVSSSGRSKPSVLPVDSHRTEAIEDCIEFINSSSSLPRSNSVSAGSC